MMADEKKEGSDKPQSSSKKWLIIGLAAALILGGGGFFFMKRGPSEAKEASKEEHAEAKPEHSSEKPQGKPGPIFDLDPFVVNLADHPEIRYLKITIKAELTNPALSEAVTDHMPQIRDSLLVLLSSKEYENIRTMEGKMELRDEILRRFNSILGDKKVKAVYFTDFVVQ